MSSEEIAVRCSQCNDTGWMTVSADGRSGVIRCECFKRERVPRLLELAHVPPHYTNATLETFDVPPQNPTLNYAKLVAETFVREYPTAVGRGILFMGKPGLGKTHLACAMINAHTHNETTEAR
jgi:DNA replication protein DnaC